MKKNILIINPPANHTDTVYSSVPLLLGQIKDLNVNAKALDLNIEFIYDIFSKKYLKELEKRINQIYKINNKNILEEKNIEETKKQVEQNTLIENLYINSKPLFKNLMNHIDSLIPQYMRHIKNNSFDSNFETIKKYLKYAIKLFFIPYYPVSARIKLEDIISIHIDNLYKYTYEDIIEKICDEKQNIFVNYFKEKVTQLKLNQYDLIAITIPFALTLYPALTLAKILKEETKANILIGGVLIHSTKESYMKHPDMFGTIFDAIMYGEGEIAFKEYVSYINGERPISSVSGLIYKENNEIKITQNKDIPNIEEIKNYSFDGIDFTKYPRPFISLEFSKGCYWGKCSYCYSKHVKKCYPKDPIKAVDMLEELSNKYNVNCFGILDDAISPIFAEKFADEIIRRNLKITYGCLMRFDKNININILKKMKESGANNIFWGLESTSPRILKLMNKGTNIEEAKRILSEAYSAGIKNDVGIMFKYPTETEEDIMSTIKFINENKDIIRKKIPFKYTLLKNSPLVEISDSHNIKNVKDIEEFSNFLEYESSTISDEWLNKTLKENGLPYIENYSKWE